MGKKMFQKDILKNSFYCYLKNTFKFFLLSSCIVVLVEMVLKTLKDFMPDQTSFQVKKVLTETLKIFFPLKGDQRIPIALFTLCTDTLIEMNEQKKVFKKVAARN